MFFFLMFVHRIHVPLIMYLTVKWLCFRVKLSAEYFFNQKYRSTYIVFGSILLLRDYLKTDDDTVDVLALFVHYTALNHVFVNYFSEATALNHDIFCLFS